MADLFTDSARHLCNDTLVLILAGGQGSRLHELTQSRAKPALEFGGNYRIIDFPLSNCINSGLKRIGVVTQYKARCLIQHLIKGWAKSNQDFGNIFEVLPASQQRSNDWYKGTADALYQNIEFIRSVAPKYVLVLSGDHIYKMDYTSMIAEHVTTGADLTVSCIEVPVADAVGQFGVMSVDDQDRVVGFQEKPKKLVGLADAPEYALASMGNYVFNTEFLIEHLSHDAKKHDSDHDFGKDIIPSLIANFKVQAYRFRDKKRDTLPYWRDVGTLDAYWAANMALITHSPEFDLYDKDWPIWGCQPSMPPAKFVRAPNGVVGTASDSLVANGCVLSAGHVRKSLLFSQVQVEQEAVVEESILLPEAKIGKAAKVRRAIIDRNCQIPDGFQVGFNEAEDKKRGFRVSHSGVVLVTQKMLDNLALKTAEQRPSEPRVCVTVALSKSQKISRLSAISGNKSAGVSTSQKAKQLLQ